MFHISENPQKIKGKIQFFRKFVALFLISFLFPIITCFGQIYISGKVYFDDDGKERPTVKILKDNLPYEESKASRNGRFNAKLPIGHDYMFEISKPYNYTTRLAVSTKFPDHVPTDDVYGTFKVETDLIPFYEGLDGTILNYPVMILRYKEESKAFVNDTVYLEAIRDRVDRLVTQIEKLEKKGVARVAFNRSRKELERIDLVEFLAKSDTLIKEEFMLLSTSHQLGEGPVDTAKKKVDTVKKINAKTKTVKINSKSSDSSLVTAKNETTEKITPDEKAQQKAEVEIEEEPEESTNATQNERVTKSLNDTIRLDVAKDSIKLVKQKESKIELSDKKPSLDNEEDKPPFYRTIWFSLSLFGLIFLLIILLKRKRDKAA